MLATILESRWVALRPTVSGDGTTLAGGSQSDKDVDSSRLQGAHKCVVVQVGVHGVEANGIETQGLELCNISLPNVTKVFRKKVRRVRGNFIKTIRSRIVIDSLHGKVIAGLTVEKLLPFDDQRIRALPRNARTMQAGESDESQAPFESLG
jgi:hypothetical protein